MRTIYLDDVGLLLIDNFKQAHDDCPHDVGEYPDGYLSADYAGMYAAYDAFLEHFGFLLAHDDYAQAHARFALTWPFPGNDPNVPCGMHILLSAYTEGHTL